MARSVSIIDYKVQQAEFFLSRLEECRHEFFSAQCYADAFVSACRSITFSVQAVCKEVPGFDNWYSEEQARMKTDTLCAFFNNYRTASIHLGVTPVSAVAGNLGESHFFFVPSQDIPNVPETDVVSACRDYLKQVVDLVFQLYSRFLTDLDDRWHYTREHYTSRGLSIEDALQFLGFPRGWACLNGSEEHLDERWAILRRTQTSGPQIQELFQKYLNKQIVGPDDPQS